MSVSRRHNWARALDMQMDTLAWCLTEPGAYFLQGFYESFFDSYPSIPIRQHVETDEEAARAMSVHTVVTLNRADTIFVTSDMLHLLMQAAHDLPEEAIVDEHTLICPYGFALFEEPVVGEDKHGIPMCINGISWEINPIAPTEENPDPGKAVVLYFWTDPMNPYNPLSEDLQEKIKILGITIPPLNVEHFYPMQVGEALPPEDDMPGKKLVREIAKIWMAMQLLAQQRIGEPIQMRPDRATRKRMARKYQKGDKLVTLITLRRKSVKKDDEEPGKVEWTRRWLVRGHWRRQYYPKTKTHDWVYIFEHIKGPDDKPFIPTERRIFDFRR